MKRLEKAIGVQELWPGVFADGKVKVRWIDNRSPTARARGDDPKATLEIENGRGERRRYARGKVPQVLI
jgi:hypothetical protein